VYDPSRNHNFDAPFPALLNVTLQKYAPNAKWSSTDIDLHQQQL
jgi:hypothetical protein